MTVSLKDLHKVCESEIDRAVPIWVRAFQEASFYVWVMPDAAIRKDLLQGFFSFRLRLGVLYGEVYVTSNFEGGVYWMPSENTARSKEDVAASGGMKFFKKLNATDPEALPKIRKYLAVVDPLHAQLAPFPHLYLSSIAVDPVYQKKGYGFALLKAMFARVDQEKVPIYLETNAKDNISYYEKLGFAVRTHVIIPEAELPVWVMIRDPQGDTPR